MYKYIKKTDLEKIVRDDRQAWVVYGINTVDKEECINECIHSLHSNGFDINKLTQPSIFKDTNGYNIVLLVRKQASLSDTDMLALQYWRHSMKNVKSPQQFIRDSYSNNNMGTRTDSITCHVTTDKSKPKAGFKVTIRMVFNSKDMLQEACVISQKERSLHGLKLDVSNCGRHIPKVVEQLYKELYSKYNFHVDKCYYKLDGRLLRYSVVPTADGIKLGLVK